MKSALRLGLRAGERIFVNGAVLRVDRKVRLELLNEATFLLEAHVMKPENATTPVRQLYFLVQGVLMDPAMQDTLRGAIAASIEMIVRGGADDEDTRSLRIIAELLDEGRYFDALKAIRTLMKRSEPSTVSQPAEAVAAAAT